MSIIINIIYLRHPSNNTTAEVEGRTRYYHHHHHHHGLSYDLLFLLFLRLHLALCSVELQLICGSYSCGLVSCDAGAGTECKTRHHKDMSKPGSLLIKPDDDGKLSLNCVTTLSFTPRLT